MFLCTQLAGVVFDRNNVNGKFQWRRIWMVPMGIMLVGTIVLAFAFKGAPSAEKAAPAKTAMTVEVGGPTS